MTKKAVRNSISDKSQKLVEVKIVSRHSRGKENTPEYHFHNSLQIAVIESGSVEFLISNTVHQINQGAVIMFGSDLPHGIIQASEDASGVVIHVPYPVLSWYKGISGLTRESLFIKESRSGFCFDSPTLSQQVLERAKILKDSEGFSSISYLFELMELLISDHSRRQLVLNAGNLQNEKAPGMYNAVERAYMYLYEHFDQDITLEQIAAFASQNPASLCRSFKKRSGYTILGFMHRLRIEKACQLLNSTDLNITEIAFITGYNTFSHFSTRFMRIMNMTPGKYRQGRR